MKNETIQIKKCANTMIRNEWNFLLFAFLFQSLIYLVSLDVRSMFYWEYISLHGVSIDVFLILIMFIAIVSGFSLLGRLLVPE